jgi:hypothetical protein
VDDALGGARSEDVVAEIKHYVAQYQASNFDFQDLTAVIKKSWIVEFCEQLIAERLPISWQLPSGTRSEALDDEVLRLLVRSGCTNITYAPESGSEATLLRIKKKVDRDRIVRSMRSAVRPAATSRRTSSSGSPATPIATCCELPLSRQARRDRSPRRLRPSLPPLPRLGALPRAAGAGSHPESARR